MSSKYPVLPPKEIIKILIPMHNEVAKGTLKSILEQANIELEVFLNLLDN